MSSVAGHVFQQSAKRSERKGIMKRFVLCSVMLVVAVSCDEGYDQTSFDAGRIAVAPTCVRYVDSAVEVAGDGQTWESAVKTVDDAIALAFDEEEATGESCEVWVREGSDLTQNLVFKNGVADADGVPVFNGFKGGEKTRAVAPVNDNAVANASPQSASSDTSTHRDELSTVLAESLNLSSVPQTITPPNDWEESVPISYSTADYIQVTGASPYFRLSPTSYTDWKMIDSNGVLNFASGETTFTNVAGLGTTGDFGITGNFIADGDISTSAGIITTNTGRVGIGTTSPSSNTKLHVVGSVRIAGYSGAGGNTELNYYSNHSNYMTYSSTGNHYFRTYDGSNYDIVGGWDGDGNLGVGTEDPDYKLDVHGTIRAEEIIVDLFVPDYVFGPNYDLMSLDEVEDYIKVNSHLPGVPGVAETDANGVSLGDSQAVLLQKIEELTLYVIAQNKKIEQLKVEINDISN